MVMSLSRFRDRLLEHDKSKLCPGYDSRPPRSDQIGYEKRETKVDSAHVIAKVRELSRLELLQETLRLFCEDALIYRPDGSSIVSDTLDRYQYQKSVFVHLTK
jgi:hypothetical protein